MSQIEGTEPQRNTLKQNSLQNPIFKIPLKFLEKKNFGLNRRITQKR